MTRAWRFTTRRFTGWKRWILRASHVHGVIHHALRLEDTICRDGLSKLAAATGLRVAGHAAAMHVESAPGFIPRVCMAISP